MSLSIFRSRSGCVVALLGVSVSMCVSIVRSGSIFDSCVSSVVFIHGSSEAVGSVWIFVSAGLIVCCAFSVFADHFLVARIVSVVCRSPHTVVQVIRVNIWCNLPQRILNTIYSI